MPHNHIDLYQAHGLDRRRSSPELAAQLAAQLATTADPVAHRRIQVASAILGDDARRAAYDAHLSNPAAPQITEAVLAQLAGMPPQTTSRLTRPLLRPRVLATVAAALVALLTLLVSLAACGGGDDSKSSTSSGTAIAEPGNNTSTTDLKTAACELLDADMQDQALWGRGESAPDYALIVTKAIDLPSQFSALTQRTEPFDFIVVKAGLAGGLIQDTNGVVYAMVGDKDATGARSLHMAKFVDGRLVDIETTTTGGEVSLVEENEDSFHGYGGYRVIAADGIDIPTVTQTTALGIPPAPGTVAGPGEQYKQYRYLTSTLADANGKDFWFFAARSNKLYQARVAEIDRDYTADKIDLAKCE